MKCEGGAESVQSKADDLGDGGDEGDGGEAGRGISFAILPDAVKMSQPEERTGIEMTRPGDDLPAMDSSTAEEKEAGSESGMDGRIGGSRVSSIVLDRQLDSAR